MPKLRDYFFADTGVFLNLDEFAEMHNIDGHVVPAIIDSDILKIRSQHKSEQYDGIYRGEIVIYVKTTDLPFRPVYGQDMTLDGEDYLVKDSSEEMGVLVITLEANEA